MYSNSSDREYTYKNQQRHVHEVLGDVKIAGSDPHSHRFATVSKDAMPLGNRDHYHEIKFRTDFYNDHYHEFYGKTSGAIPVGDRHVHFLESVTSSNDGHRHEFRLATLIEDPTGEKY